MVSRETTPLSSGARLSELMKRPQLGYEALAPLDTARPELEPLVMEQVEVELKYEGYIRRQQAAIDEMRRLENRLLPDPMDYTAITACARKRRRSSAGCGPAAWARLPASAGSALPMCRC